MNYIKFIVSVSSIILWIFGFVALYTESYAKAAALFALLAANRE